MTTPFIVYSVPRARSYWLSNFLSFSGWTCGHDEIRHARGLADVRSWLDMPFTGTVETAGAPWWRLVQAMRPDIKTVVVRRPVAEVVASLLRTGVTFDEPQLLRQMHRLDAKLDQIEARVPGVVSVSFADLATEAGCARVFEHCLGIPFDPAWYACAAPLNLQISLPATMRYYTAHRTQLEHMASVAKYRVVADMARGPAEIEGLTFQRESYDGFFRDAKKLLSEHLVQTGQLPDDFKRKNLTLLKSLDRQNGLHIFTSRCNGRMFSYLVSVLAPSLDSPNEMLAEQTIFFADPSFPGLGMKTQKAAVSDLRAIGVDRVLLRAGHRGSGPRLGALFRRMGAQPFGQIYSLPLGEN